MFFCSRGAYTPASNDHTQMISAGFPESTELPLSLSRTRVSGVREPLAGRLQCRILMHRCAYRTQRDPERSHDERRQCVKEGNTPARSATAPRAQLRAETSKIEEQRDTRGEMYGAVLFVETFIAEIYNAYNERPFG